MKRTFGKIEAAFDAVYLIGVLVAGLFLVFTAEGQEVRLFAGLMALILVGGDSFHLIPRIMSIIKEDEESWRSALGRGKQITSISITIFYTFLWHIGLMLFAPADSLIFTIIVYLLAAVRIILCLLPQNKWMELKPPVKWGIIRNAPFFVQGIMVMVLFAIFSNVVPGVQWMWLAITLSFGFYLPVVLWSNKNPKIGMLMLPKTCAYIWIVVMCLSL